MLLTDFYSLFELAQIRAINLAIEPSLESIWRMKLREYSQKFFTPLHEVQELDPLFVLQALNEERYHPSIVDEELEELLDTLNKMKDPKYSRISKEDLENLVDNVLNKEIARAAKKKAPTPETIQAEVKAAESNPKSGKMAFGDLEKLEAVSEANKAGFKD
jgi:uncharacterized protein YejL (UPF0352 family)